jgi:thioredoxin 1
MVGAMKRHVASGAVAAFAILTLVVGGCGGQNLIHLNTDADFQAQVAQAKGPVLVEFYKLGCPTCGMIEPGLDDLAKEYGDRGVKFASFKLMEPYFVVTSWDIQQKYSIDLIFPTVILFVDGKAKDRWIFDFNINDYRKAVEAVAAPASAAPPAPKAAVPAPAVPVPATKAPATK